MSLLVPIPLPIQLVTEARTVGFHLVYVVPALGASVAGEGEAAGAKVAFLFGQEVRAAGVVFRGDFFVGVGDVEFHGTVLGGVWIRAVYSHVVDSQGFQRKV